MLPEILLPLELARLRVDQPAYQVSTHHHDSPPFGNRGPLAAIGHRDYVSLAPRGGTWRFPEIAGPGLITTLWFAMANSRLGPILRTPVHAQRHLWINVRYDGQDVPAISAPLGHFFGNGTTRNVHFQSRFVGVTAGGYFAFLPMPFARSCSITVENRHPTKPVRWFFGAAGYCRLPELPNDVGYLHTQFRERVFSVSGRVKGDQVPNDPHIVLDVADGPGRFLGQTLTIIPTGIRSRFAWPYVGFPYLEGNLKVYVDDAVAELGPPVVTKPRACPRGPQSIEHTGVEDYALSAWYFQQAPFAALWHGCSVRSWLTGTVSLFRFHEVDSYPWRRRARITLTHGEFDDINCRMESLAFFYKRPNTEASR